MIEPASNYLSDLYLTLANMRITVEGALYLYDDESLPNYSAFSAEAQIFDAIGVALLNLREHIVKLQATFPKERD